jgi:Flp pilus assembly protein TadB
MTTPRPASESIIVEAPMSFTGSARRTWRLTRLGNPWWKLVTIPAAVIIIAPWWTLCAAWYLMFGLLLVPYRLLRRDSRQRKKQAAQHRETLDALNRHQP